MTRHDLDLFSLFSGLVLTGIALAALFGLNLGVAAWVWPTILIGIGVVVIATVVGAGRTSDQEAALDGETEVAPHHTGDPARTEAMAAARDEVDQADHTTD